MATCPVCIGVHCEHYTKVGCDLMRAHRQYPPLVGSADTVNAAIDAVRDEMLRRSMQHSDAEKKSAWLWVHAMAGELRERLGIEEQPNAKHEGQDEV